MKRAISILVVVLLIIILGCDELAEELSSTISGTVYDDGETVGGAIVLLLEPGDTVTAGLSLENGTVADGVGEYIIVDVITGSYYVAAIDDANDNLSVDPGVDRIGYYGEVDTTLGISTPQEVTLETDGDDLQNIDIDEMFVLPGAK